MKLPGLLVLPLFCIGILAAALHPVSVGVGAATSAPLFVLGIILWLVRANRCALAASLLGWAAVGGLALTVEQHSLPANLVSRLIESQQLDISQPMRWRGVLRENPERLPWGARFDVDLESVSLFGQSVSISGGMRASYFGDTSSEAEALRAGDRIELIAQARVPRNYQDPGAFDYRGQLARQQIFLTASVRNLALITRLPGGDTSLRYRLARVRGRLLDQVSLMFAGAPNQAAVLRAMLLGDRSFVDNDIADSFRKTSSYHVLVIAGLHVAALAVFVVWVCGKFRLRRFATSMVTLAALAGYLAVVQDRPPILRATLMAAAYLLGRAVFRRLDILQAASLAAMAILFFRPSEIGDPSFQLSFLAVAAIGGIALPWLDRTAEPLRHALQHVGDVTRDPAFAPKLVQLRLDLRALASAIRRKLPSRLTNLSEGIITSPLRAGILLWETAVISSVIQLGLMPLLVEEFHRVGIVGPIANIPAVLLTGVIVPLGFLALAISFVPAAAGRAVAHAVGFAVTLLLRAVAWFAGIHIGNMRVPSLPVWLFLAFFAALTILAITTRLRRRWGQWAAGCVVAACALAVALHPFPPRHATGQLEFTMLDVGQGDSLFLAAPNGNTLLIDGGGGPGALRIGGMKTRFDIGEEIVSRFLWSRGITKLNAVALTHAHEDHLEGLYAVLENFRVGELWVGQDVPSHAYQQLLEVARSRGTRIVHLKTGDSFSWGDLHGAVLWPDTASIAAPDTNNDSLVLHVDYGKESLLLTGDIEKRAELAITENKLPLASTFLKVAHHGSATSTTEALLGRVHPSFAAISVGENNPFNHPSPVVVARLQSAGVTLLRTDRDGAITLASDGISERVTTFVAAAPSSVAGLHSSLVH